MELRGRALLLGPRIDSLSPQEFLDHIRTLLVLKETKASKAVPDVTLTWTESGRKIVRINRENKTLLLSEVEALATEKNIPTAELVEVLTQRKIRIEDENGLWINERKRSERKAKAPKANVGTKRRKRQNNLQDKLIEPEHNPGMPTQSPV